jgi:hypothetical protein
MDSIMKTYTFNAGWTQEAIDHHIVREMEAGVPFREIDPVHITPGVLERLAASRDGFREIPQAYLTNNLIVCGMRHFRAREEEKYATEDYAENYRIAALRKLEECLFDLNSFNYDLIDKRMILVALDQSNIGDLSCLMKIRSSEFDDEVALAGIENSVWAVFRESAKHTFKLSTWAKAVTANEELWDRLVDEDCLTIMEALVNEGHWPIGRVGPKPDSVKDALDLVERKKYTHMRRYLYRFLVKSYPMEEVLPFLKAKSRTELREQLYSTDELMPYIKQFPYLKGALLEASLGL